MRTKLQAYVTINFDPVLVSAPAIWKRLDELLGANIESWPTMVTTVSWELGNVSRLRVPAAEKKFQAYVTFEFEPAVVSERDVDEDILSVFDELLGANFQDLSDEVAIHWSFPHYWRAG